MNRSSAETKALATEIFSFIPDTSSGGLPTIDKSEVRKASHRGKSLPSSCVTEYLNLPGPVISNVSFDILNLLLDCFVLIGSVITRSCGF